ncbi:SDR family oxidoreductase [Streptomyces hoynatensis]|uniref:SDR family oxidoreductase n=2 Tax=Streptomyces hoynatensis TaxID=1141874 RepID=A0A3A9ZFD2_9ACTN|nr:SDR family oxidoreductase [Streptomyces hoynatensis]
MVTGGNRGIGLAIARALADEGHRVAVTHRGGPPPEGLLAVRCDVTEPATVESAFAEVEREFGPVEILVSNAGITRDMLVLEMEDKDFHEVLETNLVGAFRMARRALPGMLRARWGRLVFVSSAIAAVGGPGQASYAASKAALTGFARSLAWELGRRGITANVVAPGPIETDMSAAVSEARRDWAMQTTPLGRMGRPGDVASAVRFLTGEEAHYITGAVLPVSGGFGMGA